MAFRTDYMGAVPHILLHPYNQYRNGEIRQGAPAKMLREKGLAVTRIDPKEVSPANLQSLNPDVIVIPSVFTDERLNMMARYAKNSPESFIVYDIEDVLWEIPAHNPSYHTIPRDIKKRLAKAMSIAHRVTVTTQVLADLIAKDFRIAKNKIKVIPNCISKSFLNACQSVTKAPTDGKMRVGWAGGSSHQKDLNLLTDVVKATADKYQWVFMGFYPEGTEDLVEFHQAVDLADYPRALAQLQLDVAVAPLEDIKFNSGKSDLRILEFAACGYAVAASDVPAFKNCPAISMVDNSVANWIIALEHFEDPMLRHESAEILHSWLKDFRMQDSDDIIQTIIDGWMPVGHNLCKRKDIPGLPSAVKRVPNGYLITQPDVVVPEMPLQGIYPADVASVSAVSNDGVYPTLGKFTELNPEAAQLLPTAAYTIEAPPVEISRITGPYVFLSDNAIKVVGMPDFKRYGTVASALVEWSIRTIEAGFKHVLKPNVFAVTANTDEEHPLMTYVARDIVAWYPAETLKGIEQKASSLQENIVETLAKLDCAAYRLIPVNEGKNRILYVNGEQNSLIREKLIEDGHSILNASTLGHLITFDPRYVVYVEPVDARRELDRLLDIVDSCGFDIVLFDGLHEGSPEILGTFAELSRRGINVRYIANQLESVCPRINMMQPDGPCNIKDKMERPDFDADGFCNLCVRRYGSAYGYVNALSYRTTWKDFLEEIFRPAVGIDEG